MKTICLVCTGNTCRSVMAEHILKNELKKNNLEYINVISCGLRVNKDDKTNDFAIKALKHIGISARKKKAKQIDEKIIKKSFLIITMTKEQKNQILSSKTFTLGEFIDKEDVLDPYGQSQEVYNNTAKTIQEYIELFVNNLLRVKENL